MQSVFYQNWLFLRKCLYYKKIQISVINIIKNHPRKLPFELLHIIEPC